MDSKLTSFVTALSEISSVTDPTYGPDSGDRTEAEISSLRDPQRNSRGREKDAVVVGVNSVASESGENVFPSVSSVTFEDDINLCECPECRSG